MFDKPSHTFEINYIYQNDPRAETYDVDADSLSQGEAARHLIELHNGDAENSLVMPKAGADEAQLLEQAEVMGITDIRVTRVRKQEKGETPAHYKQP
ncbi:MULTISPECIES: hypothetical protein [Stutzerimonas]|jgi:hypothetical protein|uniref:Uncharacterized protein n=2 Tax=Stutzerimonas TaxID=2901164 RepID=A0A9X1N5A6_9GAMM|nr:MULTISPECIES: hypothetical protein [Stutzerimonas]MCD1608161.1 hypothetical protein [Stutzerimonas kunmingensis]PNG00193.1 hypothetical protein CXK98_13300 [Stutzerimonas kunmingensis]RRV12238.1 hypothetical protein EGJ28_08045 [Stutzerimonas xanthomarina]HBB99864.1 hypothetical protein [Pseudomonas sp.]